MGRNDESMNKQLFNNFRDTLTDRPADREDAFRSIRYDDQRSFSGVEAMTHLMDR
jgi:hypothetical protein